MSFILGDITDLPWIFLSLIMLLVSCCLFCDCCHSRQVLHAKLLYPSFRPQAEGLRPSKTKPASYIGPGSSLHICLSPLKVACVAWSAHLPLWYKWERNATSTGNMTTVAI